MYYLVPVIIMRYIKYWQRSHSHKVFCFQSALYKAPQLLEVTSSGRINIKLSNDPTFNLVRNGINRIDLALTYINNQIYKQYCDLVFTIIIPLAGLIFFNSKIFLAIRKNRSSSVRSTRSEIALAKVVLSIVILFMICQIPRIYLAFFRVSFIFISQQFPNASFQNIQSSMARRTNKCMEIGQLPVHPSWMFTLTSIQHLSLIINSSVNFIIYCVMGTK